MLPDYLRRDRRELLARALAYAAPPRPTVEPLAVLINRSRIAGGCVTSVARVWPDGTTWCGLCPRGDCLIMDGTCLVSVQEFVPDEAAAHLSTWGRPRVSGPDTEGRDS